MKSNLKTFTCQDLIGKVLYAKHKYNPTWKKYKKIGIVLDETKNTIKLKIINGKKIKTLIKNQYMFRCWIPSEENKQNLVEFDGKNVKGTPAERIKKIKKPRRKLH